VEVLKKNGNDNVVYMVIRRFHRSSCFPLIIRRYGTHMVRPRSITPIPRVERSCESRVWRHDLVYWTRLVEHTSLQEDVQSDCMGIEQGTGLKVMIIIASMQVHLTPRRYERHSAGQTPSPQSHAQSRCDGYPKTSRIQRNCPQEVRRHLRTQYSANPRPYQYHTIPYHTSTIPYQYHTIPETSCINPEPTETQSTIK
jgi:hypothetical protein